MSWFCEYRRSNLLLAEVSDVLTLSDDVLQEHLIVAEREAMEAKAKFEIRNRASHHVIIMDPVLKSVHGGQQHTLEKYVFTRKSLSAY